MTVLKCFGSKICFHAVLISLCLIGQSSFSQEKPNFSAGVVPFAEKGALAGAVMVVADKEKIVTIETAGYCDVSAKTPIPADGIFWIASMSKPITGAALMVLVDEGKVQLDDPIEKYLPEFRGIWMITEKDDEHQVLRRPTRAITIRDTLRHTSGMPFASSIETPTLDLYPLSFAVKSYALTPLQYDPGTKYQYSNAGINTAARIIEVVTKQSFKDFLDQRFFGPLGMKDTTFWPNDEQVTRVVKAYTPTSDKMGLQEIKISQLTYPLNDRKRGPMPAGGLFSTGADMGVYCQMVLNHGEFRGRRYLSENAIKELGTKQTGEALKESYGLGWSAGDGWMGHGGALSTNMTVDFKRGIATVWLVQHAGYPQDGNKSQDAFVQAVHKLYPPK